MHPSAARAVVIVACLALLGLGSAPQPAQAETASLYIVNSALDVPDAIPGDEKCEISPGGPCTLRAAVMEANVDVGTDTIQLGAATYNLSLAGGGGANVGDLDLTDHVNLIGQGASLTIIDAWAMNDRAFQVDAGLVVSLEGLTIRRGNASSGTGVGGAIHNSGTLSIKASAVLSNSADSGGAGIYNDGFLTVEASAILSNTASDLYGGGIYNEGTLVVLETTIGGNESSLGGGIAHYGTSATIFSSAIISNHANVGGGISNGGLNLTLADSWVVSNTSEGLGGGLFMDVDSTATVSSSTLNNNLAGSGAGLFNWGTLNLINSTISSNGATGDGGGLYQGVGSSSLYNVTLVLNLANRDFTGSADGGGIYVDGGSVNLRNTLLADNFHRTVLFASVPDDCFGAVTSQNFNLIETTTGCAIGGSAGNNVYGQDPVLGPLQDNGGPTLTHALLPGSPAIDTGNNTGCVGPGGGLSTDQRGWARPVDGNGNGLVRCDIGAFELGLNTFLPVVLR